MTVPSTLCLKLSMPAYLAQTLMYSTRLPNDSLPLNGTRLLAVGHGAAMVVLKVKVLIMCPIGKLCLLLDVFVRHLIIFKRLPIETNACHH